MKTILVLVTLHIIGLIALIAVGFTLNDTIKTQVANYEGVTTVLSVAFGVYCFSVNFLYHKSPKVYLLVNRLLLLVRRTHTYWLPAFDLILSNDSLQHRRNLTSDILSALTLIPHKSIKLVNETLTSATICVDDKLFLILRIDEQHLFVSLDRKILVPSHLYDSYQQRFARISECIREAVRPESFRFCLTITFDDEYLNPYYGFFVRRIPSHVLRHFEASFQFGDCNSCRIEVGTTRIDIEGTSALDFFSGVSQVLALKAAPIGGIAG